MVDLAPIVRCPEPGCDNELLGDPASTSLTHHPDGSHTVTVEEPKHLSGPPADKAVHGPAETK
jgi:hypothetical protein